MLVDRAGSGRASAKTSTASWSRGSRSDDARISSSKTDAARAPDLRYLSASLAAVEWRTRRAADGYAVEARIDGAFLDEHAGEPWRTVRLGVAAVDWDDDGAGNRIAWHYAGSAGAALYWQPDRFGAAPVAGSGTFVRTDGEAGR